MGWYDDFMVSEARNKRRGLLEAQEEFDRANRARMGADIQGLLGQAPQEAVIGELGRFGVQLQPSQAGSGFRGSDRGADAQQQLIAGTQQAGYSPQQAQGLLAPEQLQQTQQQDINKYLLGKQIDSDNLEKLRVGDFANQKDRLAAVRGIGGDYRKEVAPFKTSIQYYNDSIALADKRGGIDKMTGTDDFIIMRNYLKQSLPNESVMGDDLENIKLASGGVPGWAEALIAQLTGGGYQGVQARKEILTTMRDMAETRSIERDDIRQHYVNLSQGIDGVNQKDFMREALPVSDLKLNDKFNENKYTQAEIQAELRRRQNTGTIKR